MEKWIHLKQSQIKSPYTKQEIQLEYDLSAKMEKEHDKVHWGSKVSMYNRYNFVKNELPFSRSQDWLDVGSGTGSFLSLILKDFPKIKAVGLELSRELIKIARKKKISNVKFKQIDFIDYKGKKYADLVWDTRKNEISWNKKRVELLKKLIPEMKNMNGVDYGCGAGGFLEFGRGEFGNLIGYDINPHVCKRNIESGFECVNDIEEIAFDPEILLLFHVLEHIKHPWELIRDILLKFKRIKKIVIEVPNTQEALNKVFHLNQYKSTHYSSDHLYYFTFDCLRNILHTIGLNVLCETGIQRYSLGNTFGWLNNGRGGGQNIYQLFNDKLLNKVYEKVLIDAKVCDSILFIIEPVKS